MATDEAAMNRPSRQGDDGASRRAIVGILAARGALSRREIADATGIGAATVGTQVRRLVQTGLLRELDPQGIGNGRPRVPVEIVDDVRVVGVSIEPERLVVVAMTLDGRAVAEHRAPFDAGARDFGQIAAAVRETMSAAGGARCLAVGVSLSGVVDERHEGVSVSVVLDWHDVPVGAAMTAELGLPVYVENDVLALASRELSFGPRDDSFLLVHLGDGVGMAIVAGRRVFRGDGAASTEFGHMCVEPEGRTCRCGGVGCLQTVAGLHELISAAPLGDGVPRTLEGLADAAAEDGGVRSHLRETGAVLGRAVGGAATLLGIGTVLVTGPSTQLWPSLSPGFDEAVARHTTTLRSGLQTTIVPWSETAQAAGAAGLALAKALDSLS